MSSNHLEQLVAEWYEYKGYFVLRNILVGPRPRGGFECELDIVAFHPSKKHLVHLEPSLDADSWVTREKRYRRKFEAGKKYIPSLPRLRGLDLPNDIEQIAVFTFASKQSHKTIGGGRILLAKELMKDIFSEISGQRLISNAIPEHLSILRSFQYVAEYSKVIAEVWGYTRENRGGFR